MEDRTLTITTDSGEEILCEILFTTHSEEFNKDYVVFVEKGTNTASAAIYNANDKGEGKLRKLLQKKNGQCLKKCLMIITTIKKMDVVVHANLAAVVMRQLRTNYES